MYIKAISTTTLPGARDNKQIVVISLCNFMEECSSGRSIHRMAFCLFFSWLEHFSECMRHFGILISNFFVFEINWILSNCSRLMAFFYPKFEQKALWEVFDDIWTCFDGSHGPDLIQKGREGHTCWPPSSFSKNFPRIFTGNVCKKILFVPHPKHIIKCTRRIWLVF